MYKIWFEIWHIYYLDLLKKTGTVQKISDHFVKITHCTFTNGYISM